LKSFQALSCERLRFLFRDAFGLIVSEGVNRAESDPTSALKGALAAPIVKHRAAIIEPKAFGGLLRALATYQGAPETAASNAVASGSSKIPLDNLDDDYHL
jgi:hypothetical protein